MDASGLILPIWCDVFLLKRSSRSADEGGEVIQDSNGIVFVDAQFLIAEKEANTVRVKRHAIVVFQAIDFHQSHAAGQFFLHAKIGFIGAAAGVHSQHDSIRATMHPQKRFQNCGL